MLTVSLILLVNLIPNRLSNQGAQQKLGVKRVSIAMSSLVDEGND